MDAQALYVVLHLIGFALGAGGAFVTDAIFFTSIRDRIISGTEIKFIELGGSIVWIGIFVSIVSGLMLFLGDPSGYLSASKFQLKMTVFAIIVLNGLVIHRIHAPMFGRAVGKKLHTHPEFKRRIPILLLSGVVSTVSWLTALTLGSLRSMEYGYLEGLAIYLLVIFAGVIGAFIIHPKALKLLWKL